MKPLFKDKISKFGSLISLIALTAMLMLFSLALPEFLVSTAGRIFAGIWAVIAIVVFIAHAKRMVPEKRRYLTYLMTKKETKDRRSMGLQRVMRG